ncbi:MAG: hypothetical protein RL077_5314 [Verrucomicrobiota bacterium]|jgi:hypothetical protein
MQTQELPLGSINLYGGTQARVQTTDEAVESYADEMAQGTTFPPIDVYFDGATYWLADGFHRFLATKRRQSPTILACVQTGGRTDALRHALGANATNGVCRTNADKRNAAEIALEEWPEKANPVIAELCRVSVELVRRCRTEMADAGKLDQPPTVTGRDGKEYPARMQRQARGKAEGSSSDPSAGGGGSGGFSKGKGDVGAMGGSTMELEREARAMIRKGEINPFELPTLLTANALDYAETVINLLGTMKLDDPRRQDGLKRIQRWVEKALAGQAEPFTPAEVETTAAEITPTA